MAAFRTQQNPGLSKGSTRRARALTSAPGRPLLPGGPGFPQSPWRREGCLGLTRSPLGFATPTDPTSEGSCHKPPL